jgi:hypothetical protein
MLCEGFGGDVLSIKWKKLFPSNDITLEITCEPRNRDANPMSSSML